jgi:hypothetical protein
VSVNELLRWQWEGYAKYHQSRANLLIHIVAVPIFLLGTVALVGAVLQLSAALFLLAVACIVVAVVLQGRGHRLEAVPPEPLAVRCARLESPNLSAKTDAQRAALRARAGPPVTVVR